MVVVDGFEGGQRSVAGSSANGTNNPDDGAGAGWFSRGSTAVEMGGAVVEEVGRRWKMGWRVRGIMEDGRGRMGGDFGDE